MSITEQISKSLSGFRKAFGLISKYKLRWIYILPFLIYLLIFTLGFTLTNGFHDYLMAIVESWTSEWVEEYAFLDTLLSVFSVLFWLIIKITLFILLGTISGYITLIVLSPVYAWISEKIEEEVSGVSYPSNLSKFIKDVLRAIIIALRNGGIELVWTVILFFLSFIPFVNLFTAPLLFIITAYFYGFSFLDYSHERLGLSMGESIREVRSKKFAAVSLGSIFLFLNMIPWIGPLIASLISFHLIISGTLLVLEKDRTI